MSSSRWRVSQELPPFKPLMRYFHSLISDTTMSVLLVRPSTVTERQVGATRASRASMFSSRTVVYGKNPRMGIANGMQLLAISSALRIVIGTPLNRTKCSHRGTYTLSIHTMLLQSAIYRYTAGTRTRKQPRRA